MKTLLHITFLFIAFHSFAQKNQNNYKSELDFGAGTVFSTFLDVKMSGDQFVISSPRNADVRLFGGKARLGRIMGKSPKKGIIMNISGTRKADSLFGQTKVPMFGKLYFKGSVANGKLSGALSKNDTTDVGSINGVKTTEKRNNYSALYPVVVKTIQDNIYSKAPLNTAEWKTFDSKIKKLFANANDDIELFLGFNMLTQSLPFSHLNFLISQEESEDDDSEPAQKTVIFEEKNSTTAYLLIKNFSSSKNELAAIFPKIVANENYKNLIVDLRNNGGGGIDAAFEFAKYITDHDMEVGYFVTNKLKYSGYQPELFKTLPALQPKSTKEFTDDLKRLPGAKLIFNKPTNPTFKGKLYILTNGNTGSTCEPMVYVLKQSKRATIIGEKTFGGMLAACPFDVGDKYSVMLPIADFYTYDGVRLDKVGVTPDIEVKSDDALKKAMDVIENSGN